MFSFKNLYVCALIAASVALSSWGFLVHKTVQQLAIYELPKTMKTFFFKNREELIYNAPRPDIRRNKDSEEATKHFIDLEAFGADATHPMPLKWADAQKKYTKDTLLKYGYVPYQVLVMQEKLTEAFRIQNKDSILFYAADLGHYIADANVPLHATWNYDGQLTNQKGVHSLWESMIPEIEISNYNLYTKHTPKYLAKPEVAIWVAVKRAAALLPALFEKEKLVSLKFTEAQKYRVQMRRGKESKSYSTEFAKAYAVALQSSINDQLLYSADLIADFYYTAWINAGKPDLTAITGEWNAANQTQMEAELKSFKQNQLIPQKLLFAQKNTKETE